MGVVYKLKQEVIDYVIRQKTQSPDLSCRKLVEIVSAQFQIPVSKSSINDILKSANLSSPIGRRAKKEKTPKQKLSLSQYIPASPAINLLRPEESLPAAQPIKPVESKSEETISQKKSQESPLAQIPELVPQVQKEPPYQEIPQSTEEKLELLPGGPPESIQEKMPEPPTAESIETVKEPVPVDGQALPVNPASEAPSDVKQEETQTPPLSPEAIYLLKDPLTQSVESQKDLTQQEKISFEEPQEKIELPLQKPEEQEKPVLQEPEEQKESPLQEPEEQKEPSLPQPLFQEPPPPEPPPEELGEAEQKTEEPDIPAAPHDEEKPHLRLEPWAEEPGPSFSEKEKQESSQPPETQKPPEVQTPQEPPASLIPEGTELPQEPAAPPIQPPVFSVEPETENPLPVPPE